MSQIRDSCEGAEVVIRGTHIGDGRVVIPGWGHIHGIDEDRALVEIVEPLQLRDPVKIRGEEHGRVFEVLGIDSAGMAWLIGRTNTMTRGEYRTIHTSFLQKVTDT